MNNPTALLPSYKPYPYRSNVIPFRKPDDDGLRCLKPAPFKFKKFSKKQVKVLKWWMPDSPYAESDALICDGSVRAGKTVVMSLSFIMWSMEMFVDEHFGMAGKTIGALRRNVISPLKQMLKSLGYKLKDRRADNYLIIKKNGVTNYYHIFGGKDESSQDLIQGMTLAGMFFDEVALMPESFVNQATARCSVSGRKFWFNCNPAGPYHWFKTSWLDQLDKKRALHIHFTMRDNLSLDEKIIESYERMYSGVFYQRYILGLWVLAEGIIYDMFDTETMVVDQLPQMQRYWIGVDYGSSNPTTFILVGQGVDGRMYIVDEYYHAAGKIKADDDDAQPNAQKAPSKYAEEFKAWLAKHGVSYDWAFIDPAAKHFILELYTRGVKKIANAINAVREGIELVQSIIANGMFRVHRRCVNVLRELASYIWDIKAQERGEDKPVKQNDHTLDGIRYVANGTRKYWLRKGAP